MWKVMLEDLAGQTTVARMAGRFHYGLAKAIREMVCARPATVTTDFPLDTVALSGGCFQNKSC
jgi:hydrogenase maturation factor HypF (carbamoyltransferase family)